MLRTSIARQCLNCGVPFQAAAKQVFCTADCGVAYRARLEAKKHERLCVQCGKPVSGTARYCSSECTVAGRVAGRSRVVHKTCRHCKRRFKGKAEDILCSAECLERSRENLRLLEVELLTARSRVRDSRVGRRAESIPAVARLKRARKKEGRASCEACGWIPPQDLLAKLSRLPLLHAHHVVPIASGGTDAPDNLLLLCPNHHALAHSLGSQRHGVWYGAQTRMELLAEISAVETDPDLWQRIRSRRLASLHPRP